MKGSTKINGVEERFDSPRDALRAGIATVYQDLAVVDLMETWRNFFLGSELRQVDPVIRPLDIEKMQGDHGRGAGQDSGSISTTSINRSGRCRAVSASASRSPARSTSGRRS